MNIKLSNAGKRFNREWIFRKVSLEFICGEAYAITGPNGSGKSTLLQCVGGMLQLSEGNIQFTPNNTQQAIHNKPLAIEEAYRQVSFCAPYLDLIEEMTLLEFLQFHNQFKPFISRFSVKRVIEVIGLEMASGKQIRYYSSGMKQRVKLAQAIFSDTAIVLLDEPCTNLDDRGIELYHSLIQKYCGERLVIVCSNDPLEYSFCKNVLSITDYKTPIVPSS